MFGWDEEVLLHKGLRSREFVCDLHLEGHTQAGRGRGGGGGEGGIKRELDVRA